MELYIKGLKKNNCQPSIHYLTKLFFCKEGKTGKQKLRELDATRPTLQKYEIEFFNLAEKKEY